MSKSLWILLRVSITGSDSVVGVASIPTFAELDYLHGGRSCFGSDLGHSNNYARNALKFFDAYLVLRTQPESCRNTCDSTDTKLVFGVRHGGGSYSRKAYHVITHVLHHVLCLSIWLIR